MNPVSLETLCQQTAELCQQVGRFIAQEAQAFDRRAIEYKGLNDLVSYVDKEAERQLIVGLQVLLPESQFLTEEGTLSRFDPSNPPVEGYWWIIDPLDGTTNFIHGLPHFAVSVGLWHNGRMVLGVVDDPSRNETFRAWQGGGTWLGSQRIRISEASQLSQSLLATGFPYYDFEHMEAYLAIITELMKHSHGLRRNGSAALDLAWTAAGRFEGFFEYNLNPWDVAAGALLVQEAGGQVSDFSGGENWLFGREIVAASGVFSEFLGRIQAHWPRH